MQLLGAAFGVGEAQRVQGTVRRMAFRHVFLTDCCGNALSSLKAWRRTTKGCRLGRSYLGSEDLAGLSDLESLGSFEFFELDSVEVSLSFVPLVPALDFLLARSVL